MKIKNLLDKLKEKDEVIPIEKAEKVLSAVGIDINSLSLPNLTSNGYRKYFKNLELRPYMDIDELKVKVTGEYVSYPADFHLYVKKVSMFTQEKKILNPPSTKVTIDTFGRIKN